MVTRSWLRISLDIFVGLLVLVAVDSIGLLGNGLNRAGNYFCGVPSSRLFVPSPRTDGAYPCMYSVYSVYIYVRVTRVVMNHLNVVHTTSATAAGGALRRVHVPPSFGRSPWASPVHLCSWLAHSVSAI